MASVAIIEKYPTRQDYEQIFPFKFTQFSLVPSKQDKVLKRDITLDIDLIVGDYDYIITVGAEPTKFVAKVSSVTEYQGFLMDDKFIPMLNPMAVKMRPSLQDSFDKSVKDIIKIITGESTSFSAVEVRGLQSEAEIHQYLDSLLDLVKHGVLNTIGMDTETSAFYPRDGYLLGVCISHKPKHGVYIDAMYIDDDIVEKLQELVKKVKVVFHNYKFDYKFLNYHLGLVFPRWDDTMLEHYILDETEGTHGLKSLTIKHLDLGDYDSELETWKANYCKQHNILKKEFTYDLIPFDVMIPYAATDPAATLELHSIFYPALLQNYKLMEVYDRLLKEGTEFLIQVEENGIPINIEKVQLYIDEINMEIADLTKKLYEFDEIKKYEEIQKAPFNVNSPKQKGELFFDVLGLDVVAYTKSGARSTDINTIEVLAQLHPLPRIVNDIMKLKKVKSTYLEKFLAGTDRDGRLRTNFNLHMTSSGRLSSSGKINAQQLPRKDKRPKKCIEAKPGFKIVSQDLGTAEMYVAAVLSGDKNLQKIFIDKVDYHGAMAVRKFNLRCSPNDVAKLYPEERQSAKTISFEILYKLNYKEPVLEAFPKLKQWLKYAEEYIKKNGYIYSHFGRKRRVEDVFSPNRQEAQHQVRSAINFLVQSVASDINLLAGIEMQKWIVENGYQEQMKIFGLVHDSILAEVDENYIELYTAKLAEFTQKDRGGMSIPGCPIKLDVEVGDNYAFA